MHHITSLTVDYAEIPTDLRGIPQWILWRDIEGGKVPFTAEGEKAKPNDPSTWTTFDIIATAFEGGEYTGIGFVFSKSDPLVGIDLDGCRDPLTGDVENWATEVIDACDTYAEVSPSGTGIKLIGIGRSPFERGKHQKLPQYDRKGRKTAGIEIYDHARYFAITGQRCSEQRELRGISPEAFELVRRLFESGRGPSQSPSAPRPTRLLNDDRARLVERCRKYVAKMPSAISGQRGHDQTFAVACVCFRFGLTDDEAAGLLAEFSARCEPPWSERDLEHKLNSAREEVTRAGEFGCMSRNDWQSAAVVDLSRILTMPNDRPTASLDETTDAPAFTRLMSCGDLLDADLRIDYLIPGILVAHQPAVIGGPSKSCKTTSMLDLAISLATGSKFLGEWEAQRQRVAVWSGESGAATLRSTAVRIARSKGVELRDASLFWSFDLPKLSRQDHLTHLERVIGERGIEVVIIDPLYLSLLEAADFGNASNVYAMGAKLQPIGEIGQRTNATMIVLHHFKRSASSDMGDPASLEMLSQSGITEWARQWILFQRRSPYQSDGRHEFWMRAGGSAGHAGLWAVDADEGVYLPGEPDGRRWDVSVRAPHEAADIARASSEDRKHRAQQERKAAQQVEDIARLVKAMKLHPEGETRSRLKEEAGLSSDRLAQALLTLQGTGHAIEATITKNKRIEQGYKYIENPGRVDLTNGISGTV